MLFDKIGSQCRCRYSSEGRSYLLDLLFHFFWILSPTLSASFLDVSQEFPRLSVFLTIILKSFSIYKLHSSFNLSFPLSQSCLPSFLLGVTQCVPFHFGEKNKGLNISRLQRIWGRRKKVWCSKEFLRVGEDLCSCFPWLTIIFSLYSQSQNKLQQARFWISSVYHKADKGILSVMFLLTHCSQGLGHFLHSTLSNVILISCEHTHTHIHKITIQGYFCLFAFVLSFFFFPSYHAWIVLQEHTGFFEPLRCKKHINNKNVGHEHSKRQCSHTSQKSQSLYIYSDHTQHPRFPCVLLPTKDSQCCWCDLSSNPSFPDILMPDVHPSFLYHSELPWTHHSWFFMPWLLYSF